MDQFGKKEKSTQDIYLKKKKEKKKVTFTTEFVQDRTEVTELRNNSGKSLYVIQHS